MDVQVASVAVPIGFAALGGIVWLVRLEGRQTTHEAECKLRQQQSEEFRTDVKREFRDLSAEVKGEFRALHDRLDNL